MRFLTLLGEVLPVFGTVGLLGLWFYQQTGIEARANELRKTASARAVYQSYQSVNAVFNAVNEGLTNPEATARLRRLGATNYELGLSAIDGTAIRPQTRDSAGNRRVRWGSVRAKGGADPTAPRGAASATGGIRDIPQDGIRGRSHQ